MELNGLLVEVANPTDIAEARRRTTAVAAALGFDETVTGQAAIAVTEAGTNLLKHAGGGQLFARRRWRGCLSSAAGRAAGSLCPL